MTRKDTTGAALIASVLLAFAALAVGAARIDASRGISPSQSLAAWGL